ncbi:MAG: YCF48-related protein [Bacteroidota bacterium]
MKKNYNFLYAVLILFPFMGLSQTASWSLLTSGTTTNLLGVSAPTSAVCFVCGASGTILKTINGGALWTPQTSGTGNSLYSIFFLDVNIGFAVGDNATALKTINGGALWTPMNTGASTSDAFRSIQFFDQNTGYITGGTVSSGIILKTTDGGTTWNTLNTSSTNSTGIYSVFFTSAMDGYATDASGKITITSNGGNSWSSQTSGTTSLLWDSYFTSPSTGIIVGYNGVIRKTTNYGAQWNGILSGTNDYLFGVDFYDANNGFVVGGNPTNNTGSILRTVDGGNTWSVYTPGTSLLYRVDFVNANTGYAAGWTGTILKYSSTVGITKTESEFSLFISYPNPFNLNTTIDCNNYVFKQNAFVELYDITGKVVRTEKSNGKDSKIVIEKNDMASGLYLYKVYDGSVMVGKGKMIVQ